MRAGPVILNQLGPEIAARLAAHPSRPHVLEASRDEAPWQVCDADVLLTGPSPAWRHAPIHPPQAWPHRLRWVQVASTGVDWFPPWLLRGPVVTCGRGHSATGIAEYVLAAILLREKPLDRVAASSAADWHRHQLGTLEGRVLGLAGFGAIGRAVARRAAAFGMRVLALRRSNWETEAGEDRPAVEPVGDLRALAAQSDHLVLALPLTAATRHCVDSALLAQAKPGLHLVNIARGALVDQLALLEALDRGQVGFASLDVSEPEPLPDAHPLYTHPRVRLTPHISWSGAAVQDRLARQIATNLDHYLSGERLADIVDPEHGY